jgi:ethanolamine utilization protein EutN
MQLALVVGTVVASRKEESLKGIKLMIVQKVDHQRKPTGKPFIAIDATHQAGEGDLVFLESGREAALGLPEWFNPADQAILAIVDHVEVDQAARAF